MARWLFKQEPTCYAFADLERDGTTSWDGVKNALAREIPAAGQARRSHLVLPYRQMKKRLSVKCEQLPPPMAW